MTPVTVSDVISHLSLKLLDIKALVFANLTVDWGNISKSSVKSWNYKWWVFPGNGKAKIKFAQLPNNLYSSQRK